MTSYLGHAKARQIFTRAFSKGSLHHAWILAGDRGLGKAGFARQAAHFLLSAGGGGHEFVDNPTDQASHLLAAGSHPDFRLLRRGPKKGDKEEKKARDLGLDALEEHELARNINIEQVRSLQPLFNNQSSISDYRVVIIDAADDLERGGANALLKNLEEPPKRTVFLLISHMPERLLPTIRSRCQMLRFDPLTDADMERILLAKNPKLKVAELEVLIKAGEGSPGRALQYADVGLAELETLARKIITSGDRDNMIKTELMKKLALKAASARYRAFLQRAPSLIAEHIKSASDGNRLNAIEKWREVSDLSNMAIPKALDNQAVVFRIGSLMGQLSVGPAK